MPYVQRDTTGTINGAFANRQPGFADEFLADTDPALIAFLNPPPPDPIDAWDLISLKIAFNHENRIRVLEARPAVTLTQFKTAVKALL